MRTKKKGLWPTRQIHWARIFHPLVFSTTGGLGQEATKRLADILAWKKEKTTQYGDQLLVKVQAILRCCSIINYVHPWDKIIKSSTPTWCWYYMYFNKRGPPNYILIYVHVLLKKKITELRWLHKLQWLLPYIITMTSLHSLRTFTLILDTLYDMSAHVGIYTWIASIYSHALLQHNYFRVRYSAKNSTTFFKRLA